MKARFFFAAFLMCVVAIPALSYGQVVYPNKPIQIFIGMAPGGSLDVLVRTLAQEAKRYLGQEVVCVNKPGAAGSVAAALVATAKPDGYTLGASPSSTFTVTPFFQDLNVDLIRENTSILSFAKFDVVVFVKPDSPIKTLRDFIEYAKQNPGKATYGTPGTGTRAHLAMGAIAAQEGIKINHVPFPGDMPTATAVLGGHIMAGGCSPAGPISHFQAGTLRLITVIGDERMDLFPNVPTSVELGYPHPLPVVHFLHGPKGLPESIVKKLEDAFEKASQSPIFTEVATKNVLYSKKHLFREELTGFLLNERTKTGDLIQKLGLAKK